jgi:hypothetical protein
MPTMTPAEREQRRAERDARDKAAIRLLRAKVLGSITFNEIKAAVLRLPDAQRAELVALLTEARGVSGRETVDKT